MAGKGVTYRRYGRNWKHQMEDCLQKASKPHRHKGSDAEEASRRRPHRRAMWGRPVNSIVS